MTHLAAAADDEPPRVSALEVTGTTFGLLFRNPQILAIALCATVLSSAAQFLILPLLGPLAGPDNTSATIAVEMAILLAAIGVILGWLTLLPGIVLIKVGLERVLGADIGTLEALEESAPRFMPALGLSILVVLGLIVGALLLVIPMFILTALWLVAFPACVLEELGPVESLGRSCELTRGNRVRLCLAYGFFGSLVMIVTTVPVAVVELVWSFEAGLVVNMLLDVFSFGFLMLFPLVAYVRLAAAQLQA